VRGWGLLLGIELVKNRETLEPAPIESKYLLNYCKNNFVFISVDGDLHNVIKIKPPIVFSIDDAKKLIKVFKDGLDHLKAENNNTNGKAEKEEAVKENDKNDHEMNEEQNKLKD